MVAHQTPGETGNRIADAGIFEIAQIELAILIGPKNRLLAISALDYMVRHIRNNDARASGHG
jgi:hypothetical protein